MSLSFSGTYAYFHALAAHFWISWERAVLRARVVYESLALMRKSSVQIAVVMQDGQLKGVVTLADILERILPLANAS